MREGSLRKQALRLLESYCTALGKQHQVTPQQIGVQSCRASALTMGLRAPGMMLLDDPVGTGKTPISLCVARLLFDNKEIDYALVVAPNDRVAKIWHDRAKLLGLTPAGERHSKGAKRWRTGQLIVSTQRKVPGGIYRRQEQSRTLVVIDEAHRGLSNEETVAFQAIQPLVQGTRVLLVTATPLQISPAGFLSMLTLGLDGSKKEKLLPPIKAYAKKVQRILSLWSDDADTSEMEKELRALRPAFDSALVAYRLPPYPDYDEENIPKLRADRIDLSGAAAWLRAYHVSQVIPELLSDGKGDMFQRRLVSCSEAFWGGHAGKILEEQAEQHPALRALADQLKRRLGIGHGHPKIEATSSWVANRVTSRRHVLIFCIFQETQKELCRRLSRLLGEHAVACPDEQVRGEWLDRFRQKPSGAVKPLVLIARDNLSESIDLDGGRPCIVHHDLPWNPARIQQRYGRVVRISTGFQRIMPADVYIPVLDTEIDCRMFETLVHRCELIHRLLPSRHGLRAHPDHLPS